MSQFLLEETPLQGLKVITPRVFRDDRGYFRETYSQRHFQTMGIDMGFVQDNLSVSKKGVLRGIHFQTEKSQAKLVYVTMGRVLDVAVDLRKNSPTHKKWFSLELSADNHRMLLIPKGFGHGFLCLEDAVFQYKTSDFYYPEFEQGIRYDDPEIGIIWPDLGMPYVVSEKDRLYPAYGGQVSA